jgi:glycosyltransferase involved in cell wall biosynthesis
MEASAMGVPVIATDIRGCRAAVEHDRSGLLVPPQAPVALAAALQHLLVAPALSEKMGRAGRALAVERFDERRVFAIVLDTYRRLLAEKYDVASA